jgi:hypothetical protein
LDIADTIFEEIVSLKGEKHFINTFAIEHIFVAHHNNDDRFLNWAIIEVQKDLDINSIKLLSDLVSMCGNVKVSEFYYKLIKKKIPLVDFKEMLSYPTSDSWTGSEVNVVNRKIGRLYSIIDLINGNIEYLEYKVCITEYINWLNEYKKEIRIREKLEI